MAVTADAPGKLTVNMWNALKGSGTPKVKLIDNTWTYNKDTATGYINEVTGEVTGTGYTAGGQALTSVTATYDTTANALVVDCADPSWSATGGALTARRAVFFIDSGTASTSPWFAMWDFGADVTATNAPFTVNIDATGVFRNSD